MDNPQAASVRPSASYAEKIGQASLVDKTSGRYMVNAALTQANIDLIKTTIDNYPGLFTILTNYKKNYPHDLIVVYSVRDTDTGELLSKIRVLPNKNTPIETAIDYLTKKGKLLQGIGTEYCMMDHAALALCTIFTSIGLGGMNPERTDFQELFGVLSSVFAKTNILLVMGNYRENYFSFGGFSELCLTDDRVITTGIANVTE